MLDVITLNKDHPGYLDLSLPSMAAQGVEFTGWLWDNSETRAAEAKARSYGWNYGSAGANLSYSRAHNIVAAQGSAEWILLLNDDAVLEPGCVQAMRAHDSDVVGCLIRHSEGSVNHAGGKLDANWFPDHIGRWTPVSRWLGRCEQVQYVTFAVALIRRAVWEDLGGLDEAYVYGWEDTDFCYRAREAGYEVWCCRDALATHDELGTRDPSLNERNAVIFRSRWLMADRAARLP